MAIFLPGDPASLTPLTMARLVRRMRCTQLIVVVDGGGVFASVTKYVQYVQANTRC